MTANQAEELALFSSIAKDWWDPDGPMRPLHQLNPIRLAFIEESSALRGKQVLDVGCGAGLLSEAMAEAGAQVLGIDLAQAVIDAAEEHAAPQSLPLAYACQSMAQTAGEKPGNFDVVTCMELLEHVEDPVALLHDCFTALKPGGWLMLSTINRTAPAFIKTIIGAEYVLGILPKGTHHYRQFIKPSELAAFTRTAGFVMRKRQGVSISLAQQFKASDDLSVNYMMAVQKPL